MRLAFFVLDVATVIDEYTTTRLARAAVQGGHEVWYVGLGDVEHGEGDGQLVGAGTSRRAREGRHARDLHEAHPGERRQRIVMVDLDALFLRNEPSTIMQEPPWASPLGVVFGQMLKARGRDGVNDPMILSRSGTLEVP